MTSLPNTCNAENNIFTGLGNNPPTNRGLNSQEGEKGFPEEINHEQKVTFRMDGSRFSLNFESYIHMRAEIDIILLKFDDLFDWEGTHAGRNGKMWNHIGYSGRGVNVCWDDPNTFGNVHCLLCLNGATMGAATFADQLQVFYYLLPYIFSVTRIDLAVDDHTGLLRSIRPQLNDAIDEGNVSGFRKGRNIGSFEVGRRQDEETLELGKRHSNKMVRAYDKPESVCRFELEAHDILAKSIYGGLMSLYQAETEEHIIVQWLTDIALGSVDFYKQKKKNLDRNERLECWQNFINLCKANPFKLPLVKIESTMEKTIDWLKRSTGKAFAKFLSIFGEEKYNDFVSEIVCNGFESFKRKDSIQIEIEKLRLEKLLTLT